MRIEPSKDKVKISDYKDVILHNKPMRLLIVAASINKFSSTVYNNITVGVIIFGIMMQNYSMQGEIGLITMIPNLIIVTVGSRLHKKFGQKKSFFIFMHYAIYFSLLCCFFCFCRCKGNFVYKSDCFNFGILPIFIYS